MPQIFSPSSRSEFSFCPRKWWLRKQGWRPIQVGYPELCGIGGSAISEGLATYNRARIAGTVISADHCVAIGLQHVTEALATLRNDGRRILSLKDVEFAETLPRLVEASVRLVMKDDPLQHHTLIAAEQEFADFGNARPDVISRDTTGELVVDDYKCKLGSFDLAWVDREFEKHFDGEQRLTYTQLAGASVFGVILIILQPHDKRKPIPPRVIRRTSRVQPYEVRLWKNDAAMDYDRMARVLLQPSPWMVPGKAAPHADQYGECLYRQACIEDSLDNGRMRIRYIQITPHEEPDNANT